MKIKIILTMLTLLLLSNTLTTLCAPKDVKNNEGLPSVTININPYETIYEGDIINCTITGDPTFVYWSINNQSKHTTFYDDDPVIFDPEPTPIDTDYVTLTVYAKNSYGNASDSVQLIVKRIFFGDIHWHTTLSDGKFPLKTNYLNAKKDNYLDFACSTLPLSNLPINLFHPVR